MTFSRTFSQIKFSLKTEDCSIFLYDEFSSEVDYKLLYETKDFHIYGNESSSGTISFFEKTENQFFPLRITETIKYNCKIESSKWNIIFPYEFNAE